MLGKGKGEGEDKHEGQTNKPKERRKSKDEKGPERVEKDMASGPAFLIKLYARCQCAVVLLPSILEPSLCFSNFSWAPLGPPRPEVVLGVLVAVVEEEELLHRQLAGHEVVAEVVHW